MLTPDPETGISGDTLLSEALADHTDADHAADAPGVYALELSTPTGGHETHARRWLEHYESTPAYLGAIVDADRVVYVGRSSSVRGRLEDHLRGKVRQATLPKVYEVWGIVGVRWGTNTDHAERTYADDLRAELGQSAFVHSR